MKINRHKRTQRTLSFYANNFGFREPYQVLIDGTFCQSALTNKVNIAEQLPKLLEGRVDVVTTSCAVTETEALLPITYGASLILKKFPARKCGHKKPIGGAECFASLVKHSNPNHYFIATQDATLQGIARKKPPVPVIYLHGATPTLKKPSAKCEAKADSVLDAKTNVPKHESESLERMRADLGLASAAKSRKRRRGGPNPLSCKKPKRAASDGAGATATVESGKVTKKRVRKRVKVKLPKHVKEVLKS